MTTLLEMTNRVLRQTGQQPIATLTNADTPVVQTVAAINHIIEDLYLTLNSARVTQSATVNTVAGTSTVTLATNPSQLIDDSVWIDQTGAPLVEISSTDDRVRLNDDQTGVPNLFYRQGNTLVLLPKPDTVYTLRYQYRTLPATASGDATVLSLPTEWETALLYGAQALLEKFLGEGSFAVTYQLYRGRVDTLRAQSQRDPSPRFKGPYQGYHS